ncbi:MAG: sterol desaturase family protein [bacterium]
MRVPPPLAEALIALSVLVLVAEVARPRDTWTRRHPAVVAAAFGLLHGLGFAGALAALLPSRDGVVGALLGFNLGVELGQLGFVAALLLARRLLAAPPVAPLAARAWPVGVVVMGSLAGVALGARLRVLGGVGSGRAWYSPRRGDGDSMGAAYDDPMFSALPGGGMLVSMGSFLLWAVPLTLVAWLDPPALRVHRIQRRVPPDRRALVRRGALVWLLNNALLFAVMVAVWPAVRAFSGVHGGPPPAWWVMALQVVLFIYLDDFLYYFMHRGLHRQPWLWRKVHLWHHRTKTPWAISAHDMHPLEFLATAGLMLVGPLALGCHVLVLWIWIAFRQLEAAEGHCGYAFPLSLTRLLPGSDGALHHDVHHSQMQGNFAGFLSHVDRLFGTWSKGYAERRKG